MDPMRGEGKMTGRKRGRKSEGLEARVYIQSVSGSRDGCSCSYRRNENDLIAF